MADLRGWAVSDLCQNGPAVSLPLHSEWCLWDTLHSSRCPCLTDLSRPGSAAIAIIYTIIGSHQIVRMLQIQCVCYSLQCSHWPKHGPVWPLKKNAEFGGLRHTQTCNSHSTPTRRGGRTSTTHDRSRHSHTRTNSQAPPQQPRHPAPPIRTPHMHAPHGHRHSPCPFPKQGPALAHAQQPPLAAAALGQSMTTAQPVSPLPLPRIPSLPRTPGPLSAAAGAAAPSTSTPVAGLAGAAAGAGGESQMVPALRCSWRGRSARASAVTSARAPSGCM